jgi:uncharacterized protein
VLLALALIAVAAAPFLDLGATQLRGGRAALDGFVLVAVSGLVLLHVLPHAVHMGGPLVVAIAGIGMFLPLVIENLTRDAATSAHAWALRVALLGLVAHAALDGAALFHGHEPELAWAVILHRIPAALTVWVLLRPNRGTLIASGVLVAMAIATVAGWSLGPSLASLDERLLGMFSGLVAGSLLHVVIHRPHHHPVPQEAKIGGVGALLGLGAVGLPLLAHPLDADIGFAFTVALAAGPALLVGATLAVFLRRALPAPTPETLAELSTPVAAGWGLIRPSTRSEILSWEGPSRGAIAFCIAARGVGPVSAPIAAAVLGPLFAILLVGGTFTIAAIAGRLWGNQDIETRAPKPHTALPFSGLAPWLIVGVGLVPLASSLPAMAMPPLVLLAAPFQVHPVSAILVAAGLAVSETDTGALLAMILAATTTGLPTLRAVARHHGRTQAAASMALTCFFAAGLGVLMQPAYNPTVDPIGVLSLPGIALLLTVAVLAEGPRGLLESMRQVPHDHAHP